MKSWVELEADYSAAIDMRPIVTHECVCGANLWRLLVTFDDYEIASYILDMECAICGSRAVAPTPLDRPGYTVDNLVTV